MRQWTKHIFARAHAKVLRKGFSLLECVFVVVILSLTVPVSVMFLDQRTSERQDTLQYARASTLAQSVLENVLADVSSKDSSLGYTALASSTYLDAPTTGLYARLNSIITLYSDMGITLDVKISPESTSTGVVSGTPANNVFRTVKVTATFTNSMSESADVELSAMVTDF